jgi:Ran GTPase-activating protein (RanGAP) involved in mRNA processing and transport
MPALCALLSNATSFTEIDFSYNRISDAGCVALEKYLSITKRIAVLDIRMNDFGIAGIKKLAAGLKSNVSLQTLVLRGCKIGDRGGLSVAEAVQANTTLRSLDMSDCDLEIPSLIAFRTVLMHNTTLRELVLDRPLVKGSTADDLASHMAALIQHNTSLKRLSLRKHGMTNFGAERIAEALTNNTSIVSLDLSANKIGRDGAAALAEMLMVNDTLEELILDGNAIEDEGCLAIATAMVTARTKSLKSIGVARNNILGAVGHRTGNVEMSGLVAIARAISATPNITTFRVWGNPAVSAVGALDYQACKELGLLASDQARSLFSDIKPYMVDGQMLLAEVNVDDQGRPL